MRLRARDRYTSSTLIGGKGGAGPSLPLHTTLGGPTECVNARWMWSLHGFLRGIEWIMFHGHLDYFLKIVFLEVGLTQYQTPNAHNRWFILFYHAWGPAWVENHWNNIWWTTRSHMASHYTWGSVTTLHDFGGVLSRPLDTSFWALIVSRSQLLACVWNSHESPWPLRFHHSHWWKRQSWSKFASHCAQGTNGVCECKMDVKSTWIPTWHRKDHVSWSLGLFSKLPSWM